MAQKTQAIETPALALRHCSVDEHCEALRALEELPFWWYLGKSGILGNFSLPFRDEAGNWWYQVKPGLCWPADCFRPISAGSARPPFKSAFLGLQHVVPEPEQANSNLVINAITDLDSYGPNAINAKRRNAVRKGFRSGVLEVIESFDRETFDQCRIAWAELTERTGWKHALDQSTFDETWRMLLDCPGVSIIVGRDNDTGEVAGFLVTKIIGDTAYVDTIASRTEFLRVNVNDAVMYAFLINAQQLPGITKAHYAIRSYAEALEKFKTGLGFVPTPFPTRTVLRRPVAWALKRFFPDKHRRMYGLFDDMPER